MQGTHTRSWNDATLGDVLTEIIQDAGFKARVHDDLSGIELNRVIQSIETDIEILSQLSQMYGGVIKSDGETVAVVPRDSLETASGQKLATVKIHLTECSKYSWTFRHRRSYKTVVAFYQDGEEMQTRAYVAGSGEPERRLKRLYANRDTALGGGRAGVEAGETVDNSSTDGAGAVCGCGIAIGVGGVSDAA